jgi:peroxiredoxin
VGMIFIYAAVYKFSKPDLFEEGIKNSTILPPIIFDNIKAVSPYIELILGIAIIVGRNIAKHVAKFFAIILVFYIAINVVSIVTRKYLLCNCIMDFIFFRSSSILIIFRDFIILALLLVVIYLPMQDQKNGKINYRLKSKSLIIKLYFIFLFSSIITAAAIQRINENHMIANIKNARRSFMNEIENNFSHLIGANIKDMCDIVLEDTGGQKLIIIFVINDINCRECIEEAICLEYLRHKFKYKISVLAITPKIGITALRNFQNRFNITYSILQGSPCSFLESLNIFSSVKILLKSSGEIIRIDPPTFSVKKMRTDYERLMEGFIQ